MFTGIIEELGEIVATDIGAESAVLTIKGPLVTSDAALGDSIAVNGCCLTVTSRADGVFTTDLMAVTLERTSLRAVVAGDRVNLERAVTAATRLGGHIVQGHVDATATITAREPGDNSVRLQVTVPGDLSRYLVPQGSITLDGVSLTVAEVVDPGTEPATVTVSLIPETLERTTLGIKQVGDVVNVEVDVIAKYVERMVRT